MNSEQAIAKFIDRLESNAIQYMIVGAFSCNVYGIPHSTIDADIVVDIHLESFAQN